MFIDVHCHLDMINDIDAVMGRARKAGVTLAITQGTNVESNNRALEISKKFPEVLAALGLYPISALSLSEQEIARAVSDIKAHRKRIVVLGKLGLT